MERLARPQAAHSSLLRDPRRVGNRVITVRDPFTETTLNPDGAVAVESLVVAL